MKLLISKEETSHPVLTIYLQLNSHLMLNVFLKLQKQMYKLVLGHDLIPTKAFTKANRTMETKPAPGARHGGTHL